MAVIKVTFFALFTFFTIFDLTWIQKDQIENSLNGILV